MGALHCGWFIHGQWPHACPSPGMGGSMPDDLTSKAPPSDEQAVATFIALESSAVVVTDDCRAIAATLGVLGDALGVVSGAAEGGQPWGGFGIIGLPIMGALRAAKGLAGQLVKAQTGVSLPTWTEFVSSSTDQFETYLADLQRLQLLASQYRDGRAPDPDQVEDHLRVLGDVEWRTQAWKLVLGQIARLGQVVDAILATDLSSLEQSEQALPNEPPPSLTGTLQRRFKEVQSRTIDRTGDMREWVLRPFVEVRDQVRDLPSQVDHLSQEVTLLEVLLELEIASLGALVHQTPTEAAQVTGLRISAVVMIPELSKELAVARTRVADLESWLERLAASDDTVPAGARTVLEAEYRTELASARVRLAQLEERAGEFRRTAPAVIEACRAWTRRELDLLDARQRIEGPGVDDSRRPLLLRETRRLDDAEALVSGF